MTTLLLSSRHTDDNQALWRAAIGRGWSVERVRGVRVPQVSDSEIVIYVEGLLAPSIAGSVQRTLLVPADDWLVTLPSEYTKRQVRLSTLGEARTLTAAMFVKPPNEKLFEAKVYASGADLPDAFEDELPVLVAEPVGWDVEFRCFTLDGKVRTLSPYLRNGRHAELDDYSASDDDLNAARQFVEQILADPSVKTPRAVVVDVGVIAGKGWAVVEANAAWGSGIYGCDPDVVLDVIRHATVPLG